MDETQRALFLDVIGRKLAELDQDDMLGKDSQAVVSLDQQAVGRLSRQDALLSQSMAKATQASRDAMRVSLKRALQRLDDGEFGYCDDCGDEIAQKRLELDPTASRCISCASG
ncbi:TraR/DksA family transcriptional regulator [Marivita sp. S6314]|uniref:TraR/DksA family transcriptional regulator n=1 Tax=Marivita sp. S6314 TaxID=2926406 RepID=UPI001FF4D913|nr:TraR/DksA family transcriptional regulator [Marivita sp. S6314]MCK0148804.1 TraR/DksA family transcriptional regulator [Marivita sp. S6314]